MSKVQRAIDSRARVDAARKSLAAATTEFGSDFRKVDQLVAAIAAGLKAGPLQEQDDAVVAARSMVESLQKQAQHERVCRCPAACRECIE